MSAFDSPSKRKTSTLSSSIFGDDDNERPEENIDDAIPAMKNNAKYTNKVDDLFGGNDDPWGSPKNHQRHSSINNNNIASSSSSPSKQYPNTSKYPHEYAKLFEDANPHDDVVSSRSFRQLLDRARLSSSVNERLFGSLFPSDQDDADDSTSGLTRSKFYKGLFLIGQAQNGKEIDSSLYDKKNTQYLVPHFSEASEPLSTPQRKSQKNDSSDPWGTSNNTIESKHHSSLSNQSSPKKSDINDLVRGKNSGSIENETNWIIDSDSVSINVIPEKEGGVLFKHSNYNVISGRGSIRVVRRYSDFAWLQECLLKRYPFRQIPRLPPKRIAAGYLSNDAHFIGMRTRGLVRFINVLTHHPVIHKDQLLKTFLTVPTELSVWKKQASVTTEEEFTNLPLPEGLEDSIPKDLEASLEKIKDGVKNASISYVALVQAQEKLCFREESSARDYLRYQLSLTSIIDNEELFPETTFTDTATFHNHSKTVAKHLGNLQGLLEDEATALSNGTLEDLKKQRDCLLSIKDLFDRQSKYAVDNIPQLQRRIANNEQRLAQLQQKPETKPSVLNKIDQSIVEDKATIVKQEIRNVLIKECIKDEMRFFFTRFSHFETVLYQDYAQERAKYAELISENWRGLSDIIS